MYKKLLLCVIAIIASNNVLHGSQNKPLQYPRLTLKGALDCATFGGACSTFFSLPCLARNGIYTPIALLSGSILSIATAAINNKIPVNEQAIVDKVENNHYLYTDGMKQNAQQNILNVRINKRGLYAVTITSILTGLAATALCYAGYTIEDLKSLVLR